MDSEMCSQNGVWSNGNLVYQSPWYERHKSSLIFHFSFFRDSTKKRKFIDRLIESFEFVNVQSSKGINWNMDLVFDFKIDTSVGMPQFFIFILRLPQTIYGNDNNTVHNFLYATN